MGELLGRGLRDPYGELPIVLQRGSGLHRDMMWMAAAWNKNLIEDSGMQYIWSTQRAQFFRSPEWDKWFLLAKYLLHVADGQVVCWIDSDCLLVKPLYIPEGNWDFAACRTESRQRWQVGVIWFRASKKTRNLCTSLYVEGPLGCDPPEDDQQAFNRKFLDGFRKKELDPTWNYWGQPYLPPDKLDQVKIMAWHGSDNSIAIHQMAETIEGLGGTPRLEGWKNVS